MATHTFHPDHYFTTMGGHPPVLHIAPGDTVVTTTVDAVGHDAQRQKVAGTPNPQTGPFFIDGAEPGDTLVVTIERLRPNRDSGFTNALLAPNVVDPEFVRELPDLPRFDWHIDIDAWSAAPMVPIPGLENFRVPLDPMLGCFGVAARGGEAISTMTSAQHGGNMDYRGFREGVTVYFPVFEPGALFFLGDGHATQGDGEIVGTGIETSLDVHFTVDVRKGERIDWPRGENEAEIFTVGNARPLDQALQHATTEMVRWLGTRYGLDILAASTLLGQCVEYDIANVYDPAYTVVCKVATSTLHMLGTS
ncbi:MAG: probable acetamidase/formamidase protein [uncultured Thermomicrobiales bacterium]|uniref:Probable acetamidase/formamidase protein n=1 Tax=uncultured Thermomicrobiales bacterium TaxID=1645740 RepID=A0A6J4UMP0_9BACT|nr:MAG: probable acetamidase/formamidase protein [uncultured Thermomicrobiales bacterium]